MYISIHNDPGSCVCIWRYELRNYDRLPSQNINRERVSGGKKGHVIIHATMYTYPPLCIGLVGRCLLQKLLEIHVFNSI